MSLALHRLQEAGNKVKSNREFFFLAFVLKILERKTDYISGILSEKWHARIYLFSQKVLNFESVRATRHIFSFSCIFPNIEKSITS